MGSKKKYQDKALVESAYNAILDFIRPGDVVNQSGDYEWWQFWYAIGYWFIRKFQKKLFGKESNWKDTHTMLFLDEEHTFSVETPKAIIKPLKDYCLSDLSIYRLREIELTSEHIAKLWEAAEHIKGSDYDYGQLLDILINGIMGYDHQRRLSIFDFGRRKKVCSVGVRAAFEHLYKTMINPDGDPPHKWLFGKLNPEKWSEEKQENFKGTDVEATSPAHFANSDYFQKEFEFIARFSGGSQIYP